MGYDERCLLPVSCQNFSANITGKGWLINKNMGKPRKASKRQERKLKAIYLKIGRRKNSAEWNRIYAQKVQTKMNTHTHTHTHTHSMWTIGWKWYSLRKLHRPRQWLQEHMFCTVQMKYKDDCQKKASKFPRI